jgi:hypothetical protein
MDAVIVLFARQSVAQEQSLTTVGDQNGTIEHFQEFVVSRYSRHAACSSNNERRHGASGAEGYQRRARARRRH